MTEAEIAEEFQEVGQIASIRLCRDTVTQISLRYAYVNYISTEDAQKAIASLNGKVIKGRPIRVSYSERDPSKRRSGEANICVKNLPKHDDIAKKLRSAFSVYGPIISSKVSYDKSTQEMLGYGYVHFETKENATQALEAAQKNEVIIEGSVVTAEPYVSRSQRSGPANSFTNVYVKNIPTDWTSEQLKEFFTKYGTITSAVVVADSENPGQNKGFGYVNFESNDPARVAIEDVNGKEIGDKKLFATRHLKKSDRERQRRESLEQRRFDKFQKYASCNLYIKRLPADITDEKIRETFGKFGTITSAKVHTATDGSSTGVAYVCFTTPEEANKAIVEMHGKPFFGKPLYVSLHQPKQYREAQRMNRRPPHAAYPMRGPTPAGYPVMYAYNFPPIGAPTNQFAYAPRRYPRGPNNNARKQSKARGPRRHASQQNNQNQGASMPFAKRVQSIPDEKDKKQFLGETLYPKVHEIDSENAPKITGMLLEMDITEVISLCENDQELQAKVLEAQNVLKGSVEESA